MADTLTKEQRSHTMRSVKGKNTKPELLVRSVLHSLGFRFRLNRKDLPGKPDIVLPKYKTVIFVHGCFWHRHKGCKHATMPASNQNYWKPKFERTIERDRENERRLRAQGWLVCTLWECEVRKDAFLAVTNGLVETGLLDDDATLLCANALRNDTLRMNSAKTLLP
ncbi:MAG: DNA mismatch endonuclease Vsr [Deltaproteobacteria bacterium]|nr:DNA mismatch endonuclease Vsr [Deltaproteobacteria bacterium]